jgi:hypothetical protein
MFPSFQPVPAVTTRRRLCGGAAALCLCLCLQSGCINSLVMASKVLLGDPLQKSAFEQATSVSLKKSGKRILIYCSCPAFVQAGYDSLTGDIEEELTRRMKRHELIVLSGDRAAKVLDRLGGKFDPQTLAREIDDVDYIMHIEMEKFSYLEDSSPNLYRGNATGRIIGYEVRDKGSNRTALQVFDQRFQATYPTTYPISVDQQPKNVFIRRFIDRVADSLGASFYDVNRSELYAN